MLDGSKILLVFVCDSKAEADTQINLFAKKGLITPEGYECSMQVVIGKKNLAATFNDIQKKNDAKFKFYLTAPVIDFDRKLLIKMIDSFYMEPKTAMVGLLGSEMPITGNYTQAGNFYGLYSYLDENRTVQNYIGKDPFYYKSVHMLESSFFATDEDISWDEKVGDEFVVAAQCCNMRSRGYDVGVYYQEKPFIIFAKDDCSYNLKTEVSVYNEQLEKFFELYKKKLQPLVSVLIPTYNQPKFCCEALESALNQTYQNIEILIGDDSTNEDTKKAIRPYTKKYPNVKYFYHKNSIPKGGGANMFFLLNNCKGEFVNYLLHDDLFYSEKISKMMNYFVSDLEGRISLITSARDKIDSTGKFLGRQNQWQPRSDTIINGEEVGRRMLFILANCVGELTTVLFRKKDSEAKNIGNSISSFQIGKFCDLFSASYGDMDTWLNILKNKGDMVFISESLSAFRRHEAQNTYNPQTRVNLPLDALMFVTVAWLNNVYFRNADDFYYCMDKWPFLADRWFKPISEDDSDKIKYLKEWIIKLRKVFVTGNHEKMFDITIKFLLDYRAGSPAITRLVKKNIYTGLWEKEDPQNKNFDTTNLDECENSWIYRGNPFMTKSSVYFNSGSYFFTQSEFIFCSTDWTIDFNFNSFYLPDFGMRALFSVSEPMFGDSIIAFLLIPKGFRIPFINTTDYTYSFKVNTWYHVEISRKGNEVFIFINGIKVSTENCDEDFGVKNWCTIGAMHGNISPFYGHIKEFRISIGICRHTENFMPPTKLYNVDEYTKCLLHLSK